nr:iron-containing alcohol dehydrogenase [Candidatus Sigynarchaeota archaeon]
MISFTFHNPVKLHFGKGQLENLGKIASTLGKRVLLVTHPWHDEHRSLVPQAAMFERAKMILEKAGLDITVYDRVVPNPDVSDIDAGARIAADKQIEAIVGIGGGSAMDTAKAISVVAPQGGSAWDYVFFKKPKISKQTLPVIAITTTSGTGSHMTNIAVVSNRKTGEKFPIVSPNIYPVASICDPELMLGIPRRTTIETGFDVFAHAFESFTARNANPFIDNLAIDAIRLVSTNLVAVVQDLTNLDLREKMAFADTMAGICISSVGTTVPHAMGQPISAIAPGISHGQSLMLVFPPFLERAAMGVPEKFIRVGRFFEPGVHDAKSAAAAMITWIHSFNCPTKLHEIGVDAKNIAKLRELCIMFKKIEQGPVPFTGEDIACMFNEIL